MRDRKRCAGFFGSAQSTEESGSAPGRGIGSPTLTGHPRPNPFRKLSCRHSAVNSTSGSGPTRSRARSPLLILEFAGIRRRPCVRGGWGAPSPSRPVNPARLTTWPGFGKALSGAKSAPPKTGLSAGRENARLRTPRVVLRPDVYRGLPFVSRQSLR